MSTLRCRAFTLLELMVVLVICFSGQWHISKSV
jgi:competence protein ComGC